MTKEWCYTWAHDLDQYNLASFIDANKQQKENWWSIYQTKDEFTEDTAKLRAEVEKYIGPIEYMAVWDYFEGFVDDLGPHIDNVPEKAVVFFCPRGELTVTYHDETTKEVIDSKVLNKHNGMYLNHTEFMHDIQGVGDLVVFGIADN